MKSRKLGLSLGFLTCSFFALAQSSNSSQEVTYCDLVKAPQRFAGKRIRVHAIYKYGFELQRLDSPVCCPERGPKIWVEIASGLDQDSLKLYRKFPKDMGLMLATFEGTLESGGPYGDGGYRLKLVVDRINKIEGKAKASSRHEPVWVPKNCEMPKATQPN